MADSHISLLIRGVFGNQKTGFTGVVSRIAVGSIALGIFVILITYAILFGFQKEIYSKVFSVSGHITISKYASLNGYQENPIVINSDFLQACFKDDRFIGAYPYVAKAGLIKAKGEVQGVIIKGMEQNAPDYLLKRMLISGAWWQTLTAPGYSGVVISAKNAQKLNVNIKDTVVAFFAQNPPRARKFIITGLYQSGMDELDEYLVFSDIEVMRKLNSWPDTLASGIDVYVHNFAEIDSLSSLVYEWMDYDLSMEKLTDKFMPVFDWLDLLDQNVRIFLAIIVFVAGFNLASCLLIMTMERTYVIGVLKALGADNKLIFKVFILKGLDMLSRGMLVGNAAALAFVFLQHSWAIIPLDIENYYMDHVPVLFDWQTWCIANLAWSILLFLVILTPLVKIKNVAPVIAIKHD